MLILLLIIIMLKLVFEVCYNTISTRMKTVRIVFAKMTFLNTFLIFFSSKWELKKLKEREKIVSWPFGHWGVRFRDHTFLTNLTVPNGYQTGVSLGFDASTLTTLLSASSQGEIYHTYFQKDKNHEVSLSFSFSYTHAYIHFLFLLLVKFVFF